MVYQMQRPLATGRVNLKMQAAATLTERDDQSRVLPAQPGNRSTVVAIPFGQRRKLERRKGQTLQTYAYPKATSNGHTGCTDLRFGLSLSAGLTLHIHLPSAQAPPFAFAPSRESQKQAQTNKGGRKGPPCLSISPVTVRRVSGLRLQEPERSRCCCSRGLSR